MARAALLPPLRRRGVARGLVAAVVGGALLAGCAGMAKLDRGPTYTQAELAAICQRNGGWWRPDDLMGGFCEYEGPMP